MKKTQFITDNLNPAFELREYQKEAIGRFIYYISEDNQRRKPSQLLFHMATGSGKTLLMAANILYLYNKGYRNFLFFVNSTNIIEKTRENFLNPNSSKYLFNEKIKFEDKEVKIGEVKNFEGLSKDDINILFTTIQGLHSYMNVPRENALTYEDFRGKKIIIISDEAHHINAWTKNKLNQGEQIAKNTWEHTVGKIINSNTENIMLEYTATVEDLPTIYEKYENKIIYEYSLKQFRQDGYSKEVKVLQADLDKIDRMLQAMILSQYRRKIAERNKLHLKPVLLFKSKTIKESEENYNEFEEKVKSLKVRDIQKIKAQANGSVLQKAFDYFKRENIVFQNLVIELKEDFSEEKCMLLDSKNIDEIKQLRLNSLENKNNEIRAIFAVDMLNEGWDVLNLFDIVRLYNTRDSKKGRPGRTTIREAQLIGRGARYFPFKIRAEEDKFKRKFDQELENDLKITEELYYHSSHNPRYIQELTAALRETGIMPAQEPRSIQLKVKDNFKKTNLWKNGFIFLNEKREVDRSRIRDINDLDISKVYNYQLRTGFTQERIVFEEEFGPEQERISRNFSLETFPNSILRKAVAKSDFYKFNNLKIYFPRLNSTAEFIDSLKSRKVQIRSSKKKLDNLSPDDKLEVCLAVLDQLELEIKESYTEYKGTKLFVQNKIKDIVEDKTLNINVGDSSEKEYGIEMSKTTKDNLRLKLFDKDWYIYDENYGTSEEKHFIQFINGVIEKLQVKYSEIYLLRNENLFKIYKFSDGRAMEPDFVLFMKEKGKQKFIQYQLFIEPKGNHLLETDRWKQDFLMEIKKNYQVQMLMENEDIRLLGLPFYNEDSKSNFIEAFNKELLLD